MQTKTLESLFNGQRLFRIPDYQRGYAWGEHQYQDFWEDLFFLDKDKKHYTGVLTLEKLDKSKTEKWQSDKWFFNQPTPNEDCEAYYLVDGQQRLTTSIILIQAILEYFEDNGYDKDTITKLRRQYILAKHPDTNNHSKSYIFGYDSDNPSNEYLKTKIFKGDSPSGTKVKNLYTKNLYSAKKFFKGKLNGLTSDEVQLIFYKLTEGFIFSLYEITPDIDINVAFETMNNRGKPLTVLEKLKNRLIYLTTFLHIPENQEILREKINEVWKTLYEYLGKNPDQALLEDVFLKNHWIMYFTYSRKKGDDYVHSLLDDNFSSKPFIKHKTEQDLNKLDEKITKYISSLQKTVTYWYSIHFPYMENNQVSMTDKQKKWLKKLNRLDFKAFRPLILACFLTNQNHENIETMLKEMERYNFTIFGLSQKRSNTGDTHFYSLAREILNGKIEIKKVIETIEQWQSMHFNKDDFAHYITEKFKTYDKLGFYKWDDLRYFLFEYEQNLRKASDHNEEKIIWEIFNNKDYKSVEHILPQTADDVYWQEKFCEFDEDQRHILTHSLGNLLALSTSKNASLQNKSFDIKKRRNEENIKGYHNGSFSEKEVAEKEDWTAQEILERGMKMLNFMEEHWSIDLGTEEEKLKLLHLDTIFNSNDLPKKSNNVL